MNKINVTLAAVKESIQLNPRLKASAKTVKQNALRSFLDEVKKRPDEYNLSAKSEKAIVAYIDGLAPVEKDDE